MSTRCNDVSKESSFLRSCLAEANHFHPLETFQAWLKAFETTESFRADRIPFDQLRGWSFGPETGDLGHESGKFFSIQGLDVQTGPEPARAWQQPIINQPEIGILGIIARKFDGVYHFLMQAKAEPGNVYPHQLSPTLQATKSNYTQVHKGKLPLYLDYFIDRSKANVLVDRLQSEQGSRFFRKRNRNMIVEVHEDLPIYDHFIWLTLHDIKQLLKIDNLVNMDARSVLACISLANPHKPYVDFDEPLSPFGQSLLNSLMRLECAGDDIDQVLSWFTEGKARHDAAASYKPLNQLQHWIRTETDIHHESGDFFTVVAVDVETGAREVAAWTQPLVAHPHIGVIGWLVKEVDGVAQFLVQAKLEPGNHDVIEMAPTVSCSSPKRGSTDPVNYPFLEYFLDTKSEQVKFSAIQSEEGGRFYQVQNRYMIVTADDVPDVPRDFKWMSLGQIVELTRHPHYFNVEARSLLACILNLIR